MTFELWKSAGKSLAFLLSSSYPPSYLTSLLASPSHGSGLPSATAIQTTTMPVSPSLLPHITFWECVYLLWQPVFFRLKDRDWIFLRALAGKCHPVEVCSVDPCSSYSLKTQRSQQTAVLLSCQRQELDKVPQGGWSLTPMSGNSAGKTGGCLQQLEAGR